MCPCPICATIAVILAPFLGYKWVKKLIQKHHCSCAICQKAEHEIKASDIKPAKKTAKSQHFDASSTKTEVAASVKGAKRGPKNGSKKAPKKVASKTAATRTKDEVSKKLKAKKRSVGRPKGAVSKKKKAKKTSK